MSAPSIRLFVSSPLQSGMALPGSAAQAHYLATVMRRAAGDAVVLFNGVDGEFLSIITTLTRKVVAFTPQHLLRPQLAGADCWLCFALLKRQKTDLVVEKATELGVARIQPVITQRTQATQVNLERLRDIATEAAEQCERLMVPEIMPPVALPALIANWPAQRRLLIADERRTAGVITPALDASQPTALMIGPEGGFTSLELDAIGVYPFVTRVSLGQNILRAETAAIAGLALLLASLPAQE